MKQFLLFAALFFAGTLTAQLSLESDTLRVGIDNDADVVAKNIVINGSGEQLTFTWERNIVSITDGWQTAVCDVNQCWLPSVGDRNFGLLGNSEGTLDVHVYPGGNTEGSALIEVNVFQTDDTTNAVTAVYIFDSSITTNTNEPQRLDFKVFPNPTTGLFSIEGTDGRAEVLEVYSTTGRLLTRYHVQENNWYDLANLGGGNYLIRLTDRDGQQLGTKFVTKL